MSSMGKGTAMSTSALAEGTGESVSAAASTSVAASGSTGAAASLEVVHTSASKIGMFTVVLLAVVSAVGMLL